MVAVIAAQGQAFLQQLRDGVCLAIRKCPHFLTGGGEPGGYAAETDFDDLEAMGI